MHVGRSQQAELDPEGFCGKGAKYTVNDPKRDEAGCELCKTDDGQPSTDVSRNEASHGALCNGKRNFMGQI